MRRFAALLSVTIAFSGLPVHPRSDLTLGCGHHPDRGREELFLHRRSLAAGKFSRSAAIANRTASRDSGDIAVLEDSGGVVSRRNSFNLEAQTVRFLPQEGNAGYRFETIAGGFDESAADAGTAISGLGDDDTRRLDLPFAFSFFGKTHRALYLNSDGNLTFEEGDVLTSDRGLGRLRSGPPRIAPLFEDLDPSRTGSVRVLLDASRFVATWSGVPEFRQSGTGPRQTFQVRLYANGRIEFSWSLVTLATAVVGISPGRLEGALELVSFLSGASGTCSSAVAERFTNVLEIDVVSAAQQFYLSHEDAYDYLVFFNTMGISPSSGALAYQLTVRSNRGGIGDPKQDAGLEYGSRRRLQAVLNIGPLENYPRDPNAIVPLRATSRDTPLTILGHEAGHLFLAYASVRDEEFPDSRPMLGRQLFHWNFFFNSDASLLEGNRIQDNGPGASPRFTTTAVTQGYSLLDQYLMGLRAPDEVTPTFLVTSPSINRFSSDPQPGVSFDGRRRDIRIEEIVEAEGRRIPDHTVAQRRFRFAFVLITAQGSDPSPAQLEQVDRYRREFEAEFAKYTSGLASADTSLRRAVQLSLAPAAGVVAGARVSAEVRVERPVIAPLTLLVEAPRGFASVPPSVTIAKGAARATFLVEGLREGVEELRLAPAGADASTYETVHARVQVASLARLTLSSPAGPRIPAAVLSQPAEFVVSDANELPYPGVRVQARASAGGMVDAAEAVTDAAGVVRFRWTPATGAVNELTVSIPGGPSYIMAVEAAPRIESVLNAASWQPSFSPGTIAVLFGSNLGGGRVWAGGTELPQLFSSNRQINFVIPLELSGPAAEISVATAAGTSQPLRLLLQAASPGIFFDSATNAGAIRFAAPRVAEVYATGLGPVRGSALSGTVLSPGVFVAGTACQVLYSGLSPAVTGLYQVNIAIPETVPAGAQELYLETGGRRSNTVQLTLPPLR
jgi:uncharacterized protein (TIGR03437 family)